MFDRAKSGELAKGQLGFIDFVAKKHMEVMASYHPNLQWLLDSVVGQGPPVPLFPSLHPPYEFMDVIFTPPLSHVLSDRIISLFCLFWTSLHCLPVVLYVCLFVSVLFFQSPIMQSFVFEI